VTRCASALALAAMGLAALLLAGCPLFERDVAAERLPRYEPLAAAPKLAIVLGSGGPRGFAHIGVLKVLDEAGIHPDLIVGSSVGAMVGAIYAGGMSAADLEREAYELNILQFFEMSRVTGGLANGRAVQDFVNAHVGDRPIEKLKVPFAAAATRVSDQALVIFTRGDTGLAVRASGASPGQFEPVKIGSQAYVDGDEASPVPIRAARQLGARFVIAVDVSAYVADTPATAPQDWIDKDARRAKQVALEAPDADILIHPNIGYYAGQTEQYRRRVIATAERVTREKLPQLRAALARAGIEAGPAQSTVTARTPASEASR
jgi:NTE family protein